VGARAPRRAAARAGAAIDLLTNPDLALLHPTGAHPEHGGRIAALAAALPVERVERRASETDVLRVHTPDHLARLRAIRSPTMLDADTPVSATSLEAALLASGIALEAVERQGFALVRPPGHHAPADRAMGFCLLNNAAIAVRYAQAELGLARVAIVDFDVHHGNGTEAIFRGDDSVLFASLHQWPFYPGTGGPGTGDASTVNVPLAAGVGDDEVLAAFEAEVEPALVAFAPDLVLVSAGFDAHRDDPLGGLALTVAAFGELAARCAAAAPRSAAVLEGGYDVATLPRLVAAAHEGFTRPPKA